MDTLSHSPFVTNNEINEGIALTCIASQSEVQTIYTLPDFENMPYNISKNYIDFGPDFSTFDFSLNDLSTFSDFSDLSGVQSLSEHLSGYSDLSTLSDLSTFTPLSGTSLFDKSINGTWVADSEIANYFTEEQWNAMKQLAELTKDNTVSSVDKSYFDASNNSLSGGLGEFSENHFFDMDYYSPGDTLLYECFIDLEDGNGYQEILEEFTTEMPFTFIAGVLKAKNVSSNYIGTKNLKFTVTDLQGNTSEKITTLLISLQDSEPEPEPEPTVDTSNTVTVYSGWNLIGPPFNCKIDEDIFEVIYSYDAQNNKYEQTEQTNLIGLTGYWAKTTLAEGESTQITFIPLSSSSSSLQSEKETSSSDSMLERKFNRLNSRVNHLENEMTMMKNNLRNVQSQYTSDKRRNIIKNPMNFNLMNFTSKNRNMLSRRTRRNNIVVNKSLQGKRYFGLRFTHK